MIVVIVVVIEVADVFSLSSLLLGPSGKNIDYLENLREWLVSNDQKDPHVENLYKLILENKEVEE